MKLKALTVAGFKSFADKTTFDFHDGVTCVVGPNGCGKSNVVDAFKWVLGERSAKSLRGDEMLDVIFNGTPQRPSSGRAEVTLAFEDAAGVLGGGQGAAGTGDHAVTITRRLYRSGESEYLINGGPARLKDIQEMFLDTGVGADAYSLIEQGRIGAFLQASPADRRAFFDEAAGISRYKARKREALRRLERVDQDLLRLSDILGEIGKRLRSIKYQAGKARSYQAYSTALNELRCLFGLAEYHRLSLRRSELERQHDGLSDALAGLTTQIGQLEAARTAAETEAADLEQAVRALDAQVAAVGAEITAAAQRTEMLQTRQRELTDAITAGASRCEKLEARIEGGGVEASAFRRDLADLSARLEELAGREQGLRAEHDAGAEALQQLEARLDDEKNGTIELLRRTAQLHNEVNTHDLRHENLRTQRQRLSGRSEEMAAALEELLERRAALAERLQAAQRVIADSEARLEEGRRELAALTAAGEALSAEEADAARRHAALLSRQELLEEMRRRHAGVGEAASKALAAAAEGRLGFVRGMLGDLVATDVADARIIEAALGPAAQCLLVDRADDLLTVTGQLAELLGEAGGVELLCLETFDRPGAPAPADEGAAPPEDLPRAADRVRCDDPAVAAAVRRLLGDTLVVPSLPRAFELRNSCPRGWRFVTPSGQVLEADGRIRIGAAGPAGGVVWRRSELAALADQLVESAAQGERLAARRQRLRADIAHAEQVIHAVRTAIYEANTERVEQQTLLERIGVEIDRLQREAPLLAEEVRQLADQIASAVHSGGQAREKAAQLEALSSQRQAEIARLTEAREAAARRQGELAAELTAAKVELAQARQRRSGLEEALARLEAQRQGLAAELAAASEQIRQDRARLDLTRAEARQTVQQTQALVARKAALAREAEETRQSRLSLTQRLEEVRAELAAVRARHDETAAAAGEARVSLGEVDVRIEGLISRTAEEIGMDLPAAHKDYRHDDGRDWEAVRAEIADLRGKIERLGNVNLDAIAEQEELQQRETFLTAQVEDVRASQRQLADLIKRINAESRRRFEESFSAVRANFNELFRKLFGGGKADILLLNPEDTLGSDIEIVARPPGKDLTSISLLSGGEKTLTALALMFSFFKARPSPFCLLDEVDAALDEANTQRFVRLVREFLDTSQFVIVSHAKRTIAMADQIYGVTMQEPGVSKRISVRFEQAQELTEQNEPAGVAS